MATVETRIGNFGGQPKVITADRLIVSPYSQRVALSSRPPSGRKKTLSVPVSTCHNVDAFGGQFDSSRTDRSTKSKAPVPTDEEIAQLNEINSKITKEVTSNFAEIKKFFQIYDRNDSFCVTKSDLKTVLSKAMSISLSENLFALLYSNMRRNKDGSINYNEFMQQFFDKTSMQQSDKWLKLMNKRMTTHSPQPDVSMDKIERNLKEKIASNMNNIVRAFQLCDYNRDEHIQKHEMRKVLENFCFRMTDNQFDRLWARYDLTRSGVTNYKEFLLRLGIDIERVPSSRPASTDFHAASNEHVKSPTSCPRERQQITISNSDLMKSRPRSVDVASLTKRSTEDPINERKSFTDLEREFRRLMKRNHEQILRTCQAFDPNRENKIAIDNLRNILTRFTIPLSQPLFNAILTNCGFKATSTVPWCQFVEYFAEPFKFSKMANSLPIKPSHQFLPHKSNNADQLTATQIVDLIQGYVEKNYESMKKAFLAFDPEKKGKIMRNDLRRIIESFCMKLTDSQFKELIILLDPTHQGFVDYFQFLALFEMEEYPGNGPKWLSNTSHQDQHEKFQNNPQQLEMGYNTIENVIRQKLTANAKELARDLVKCGDQGGNTLLSKEELGHLIHKYASPISEQHLSELWNRMKANEDGKVTFNDFMKVIGIISTEGDISGLSSLIAMENDRFLEERQLDHENRLRNLAVNNVMRTNRMSMDEVISMIKQNIYQKDADIRREFVRYDSDRDGRVNKSEFRKILNSLGLPLDFETFDNLCKELKFSSSQGLTYLDFLQAFQDWRVDGPGAVITKSSNHVTLEQTTDQLQQASTVVPQLKGKLLSNHDSLREAFYKGDHGRKGYWDKNDFRHLLDKHMFFLDEHQFEKLMRMIGMSQKGTLVYKEFVDLFQETDHANTNTLNQSSHTAIKPSSPSHMAAEQVYDILKMKASSRFPDLTRAFRLMEKDSNGRISKSEFKKLLWKFNLPMSQDEFERLWKMFDQEGVESVSFQEFCHFMGLVFSGPDTSGMSMRIIENNARDIEDHLIGQKHRQIDQTEKQMQASATTLTAVEIEKRLREQFTENFATFFRAFRTADVRHDGYISVEQLYNILLNHNYVMNEETFEEVLRRLGLPLETSKINYERFLKSIDSTKRDQFVPKLEDELRREIDHKYGGEALMCGGSKCGGTTVRTDNWSVNKLIEELKMEVTKIAMDLLPAFQSFDEEDTGRIKATDFRRVIESFCFPMKDSQFKGLIQCLHLYQDLTLNYLQFLDNFVSVRNFQDNGKKGAHKFSDMVRVKTPMPREGMSIEEVSQRLREIVTSRFYNFASAFKTIDYGQLGVITQNDFRNVLHKLAFRLLDEQFEQLLCRLVTDQAGNVDYTDFLKEFCSETVPTPTASERSGTPLVQKEMDRDESLNDFNKQLSNRSQQSSRPKRSDRRRPMSVTGIRRLDKETRGEDGEEGLQLTDAHNVEMKLKKKVNQNWKSMQTFCRLLDGDNSGTIYTQQFKHFLEKLTVELTEEEKKKILDKFSTPDGKRFDYRRFLKHFVYANSGIYRSNTTIRRPQTSMGHSFRSTQEKNDARGMSDTVEKVLSKLRPGVEREWKTMRREMKRLDEKNKGKINVDQMKQILFLHNFNLSSEEFFMLCDLCDKDMSGDINYNEFFRAILK